MIAVAAVIRSFIHIFPPEILFAINVWLWYNNSIRKTVYFYFLGIVAFFDAEVGSVDGFAANYVCDFKILEWIDLILIANDTG